jgi:hypothetical protein
MYAKQGFGRFLVKKSVFLLLIILILTLPACAGKTDNRFGMTIEDHIAIVQKARVGRGATLAEDEAVPASESVSEELTYYIADGAKEPLFAVNISTKKFHLFDCASIRDTNIKNRADFYGTYEDALSVGLKPCGRCKP